MRVKVRHDPFIFKKESGLCTLSTCVKNRLQSIDQCTKQDLLIKFSTHLFTAGTQPFVKMRLPTVLVLESTSRVHPGPSQQPHSFLPPGSFRNELPLFPQPSAVNGMCVVTSDFTLLHCHREERAPCEHAKPQPHCVCARVTSRSGPLRPLLSFSSLFSCTVVPFFPEFHSFAPILFQL